MRQPVTDDSFLPVEALLARVQQLSGEGLARREFHDELLRELVDGLAADGGVIWVRGEDGRPRAECQIQLRLLQLDESPNVQRLHAGILEQLAAQPHPRILPPDSGDGLWENPTHFQLCFQPLGGQLGGSAAWEAVLELFFSASDEQPSAAGLREVLEAIRSATRAYYLAARLHDLQRQNRELQQRVDFFTALDGEAELARWAIHLVHQCRQLFSADRAGLLVRSRRRCRLVALSGVDTIERRSEAVRRLERLATAVLFAGPIYPTSDASQFAPQLEQLLAEYLEESSATALCLLPLGEPAGTSGDAEEDAELPSGELLLEWYDTVPPDDLEHRTDRLALPLARRLAALRELERLPLLPLARLLRSIGWKREGSWRRTSAMAAVVLLVVSGVLAFVPAELSITATGVIQPVVRADVFAPADGIVIDIPAARRRQVDLGETLAVLRSPELDRKWNEVWGQLKTTEQSLAAVRAARLQLGRGGEPAPGDNYAAQELELVAVRDGLLKQAELLEQEQQALTLRSPLSGEIVTWDLRQLAARPVRHGERLLRVVDPSGPWQLHLDIPEPRAGHVLEPFREHRSLKVTYMLESAPVSSYEGRLTRLADATSLSASGSPVVEARVDVEPPANPALRPGSSVTARIHCGRRSLGYVWFHRLLEAFRLRTF